MKRVNLSITVALFATLFFTSCEPKEPKGNETITPAKIGVKINGVVWAPYNVDAFGTFAAKPESTGMFYQWNKPTAWAATGSVTGWDNSPITGTTWAKANDPSPKGWRVPTKEELESLVYSPDKVTSEFTTVNNIFGRRFTDKATGNSIFLPAAGARTSDGSLHREREFACYWSSTDHADVGCAYALLMDVTVQNFYFIDYQYYNCGLSVRSVAAE